MRTKYLATLIAFAAALAGCGSGSNGREASAPVGSEPVAGSDAGARAAGSPGAFGGGDRAGDGPKALSGASVSPNDEVEVPPAP